MLKTAIILWVINDYHRKYLFKDFTKSIIYRSWYLSSDCEPCDSRRDRKIPWQLSGIGNILDYHPVENRRVFVARASPTTERVEITPNHTTSTDLFSAIIYRRMYFCNGADCCFPSHIHSNLICNHVGNTTIVWKDNSVTADATECFSITASTRKDSSF